MTLTACILSKEAALELRGSKIPAFLQGQLTCDTRKLTRSESIGGALCNPKGRVISDIWALEISEERLLLRLRASVAETTATILARYAQFSRITAERALPAGDLLGIRGDTPDDLELSELAQLPEKPGTVVLRDHCFWLRRGPNHGEIGALDDRGRETVRAIASQMTPGAESHWQAEDLRRGHYAIDDLDMERFTPQALNYDLTGRVAFDKGCYTGQEVVARLHYKGQSKRRLAVLHSASNVVDEPGSKISGIQGTALGKVLKVIDAADGGSIVGAELVVDSGDGALITESGAGLHAVVAA